MRATARVSDVCDHGAVIITGASTIMVNGLPVARVGDLVSCPLDGHGINPIIAVEPFHTTEGKDTAHISARTACGAVIITASPDTYRL